MQNKRLVLWILLLLTAGLLLSGCGSRTGAGETIAATPDGPLVTDLPALIIDYDAEGNPTVDGAPLDQVATFLPTALLSQLKLGKATIDTLTAANIQNLQISNTPTGLRLLVNGQALPTIVWDRSSLAALINTLETAGISVPTNVNELLTLATNLGVGVVLRFPLAQSAEIFPLEVKGAASNAATLQGAMQKFVAAAGSQPIIQIPVYYNSDGTWTVEGISDTEWQALTGAPFGYIRLKPEWMSNAIASGLTGATLRTDPQGIHLALNGKELPYISWKNGGIKTALSLAQQLGLLKDSPLSPAQLNQLVDAWLPALQAAKVTIQVHFPTEQ